MKVKVLLPIEGGHKTTVIEIEIGDQCPICGGARGNPTTESFHEGGELLTYDIWENECGHVDEPKALRAEARAIVKEKMRDKLEVNIKVENNEGGEDLEKTWNKTWDRSRFLAYLEKFKEDLKSVGIKSSNVFQMNGDININMEFAIGKTTTKITGTAKLIRFKINT